MIVDDSVSLMEEEQLETIELNDCKQLAENLMPLVSPALVLIGITGLSIHARAMQVNPSDVSEEISWVPFYAGITGLLLVQLIFRQPNAERRQTGYLTVAMSTACMALSFGALLLSPQTQQSWLSYGERVTMGLYATVSTLAYLQDDSKKIKDVLNWFAISLMLLLLVLPIIAHRT